MPVIKKNINTMQDKHKIYVDQRRVFKEFCVGEHLYLYIKPKKSSFRIGSCANFATQYCGPFEILERTGPVEY